MIKLIPLWVGAFVGTTVMCYLLDWSNILDGVYIPFWHLLTFSNVVVFIQISFFAFATLFFAKTLKIDIVFGPYVNFILGLFFSIVYLFFATREGIINFKFPDADWFFFMLLPLIVFIPMLCTGLLLKRMICKIRR